MALPPTFEDLRALVRGELAGAERAAVATWLVAHADERTAAALDALAVEWREVQRDRALPAEVAALSGALWAVFAAGRADVDPDPAPRRADLLRASPAAEASAIPRIEGVDVARRVVRVVAPPGRVIVATNDRGDVTRLDPGDDYHCEPAEGRVTFWALAGSPPADARELFLAVQRGLAEGTVSAVRITDELFVG